MSISSRHNGVKRLLAFCTCAVLLSSCGSGSESALTLPQKSTFPGKEWEKGAIPQFVDQESLRQRIDPELQLYEEAPAVQSAVVVYRGRIIYETYSPLYTKDTVALSYSIAKSVLFAAIGIAIDQGLMRVTDTHLSPVWSDTDPRSKISVENMLHMESGLEWGEDWDTGDPLQLVKYSSGAAAFAAEKKLLNAPGSKFNYSTGNSAILAAYLTQKVGGTVALRSLMNKHLFTPLGMTSTQLVLDKTGVWVGGVGANSTPRDFARFGWLFANKCIWNGNRILSSGWCDLAARSAKTTAEYGSHWWKLEPDTLSALGIYGQAIVVNEKLETVVVVNSSPGSEQDRGFELALSLVREISPSANS